MTFDKSDARSLLARRARRLRLRADEPQHPAISCGISRLALRLVRKLRPKVVVTTGAGVAVPFAWIARLRGARVVYVESFTRIDGPSLSCRLIAPVAARVYAQWPELAESYRRARYVGNVFLGQ